MTTTVHPDGWPRPRGYTHGVMKTGALLAVAGQVGTRAPDWILAERFVDQFAAALDKVVTIVKTAGGQATDVVSLTIYVTDLVQYEAATAELGVAWRARFGQHYPAMTLVAVKGLLEPGALVEIQGLAVL